MRLTTISVLIMVLFVHWGCSSGMNRSEAISEKIVSTAAKPPTELMDSSTSGTVQMQKISLNATDKAKVVNEAMDRKIIRNADLSIELTDPHEGQRKITSIAEANGGFVVTSEATHRNSNDDLKPNTLITVTVRVPSTTFSKAMDEIRKVGNRVNHEKVTGQDVTEEYIDLEARIKTQKALEAQFLEIMKQANNVTSALEVQRQIAEVRTEIERLEGRLRYLENQSSLSTINITLQTPMQMVSSSGFYYNIKKAFNDGIDVAAEITLFFIRLIIVLIPVAAFIFLPLVLLFRYLKKRAQRLKLARELSEDNLSEVR
jgi:polyhydroxyalkanoate synthesis regulator phasin